MPLIHEVNDRTAQFSHTAEHATCPNLIKKQVSAIHHLETQDASENSDMRLRPFFLPACMPATKPMRDGQVSLTFFFLSFPQDVSLQTTLSHKEPFHKIQIFVAQAANSRFPAGARVTSTLGDRKYKCWLIAGRES